MKTPCWKKLKGLWGRWLVEWVCVILVFVGQTHERFKLERSQLGGYFSHNQLANPKVLNRVA